MELFEDKGMGRPDLWFLRGAGFCFAESLRGQPPAERGFSVKAHFILLIGIITPAVLCVSARSQEVTFRDTVYSLPEILVEAERISDLDEVRDRPAFVTIIPIDDADRRISSAADYVAQTVGVHVQSTGGYGSYSTASIRGSSARQVQVYLDGVPLGQGQTGVTDLADLPMASVERIEVYRGFGPFDLSGSNIGGVINVVTKRPDDRGRGVVSASYGSFSTGRYEASYGLSRRGFDVLAIGSALTTKGDFDFLDDNGTPYNAADDEIVKRINNDLAEYEALVKLRRRMGGGSFIASNQFYYRRQGLPGYGAVQSSSDRITKTYNLFHLEWQKRWLVGVPVKFGMGAHYLLKLDHFEDRRIKKAGVKPDEKNRTVSVGADLRWQVHLPGISQSLGGLLSLRREAFQPEEIYLEAVAGETQRRTTVTLSVEDDLSLCRRRLRLVPSLRYERYTDHTRPFESVRADMASYFRNLTEAEITRELTSGSVGLVVSPGLGLEIKANYGRYYRVPTLMEVFGYRGLILPNPELSPETGLNRDVGFRFERRIGPAVRLAFEYARFWSDVERLIMFVYVPFAGASQATNVDRAEIDGHEFSVSCGMWHGLSLAGNLTALRAVNTGPISYLHGKHLPQRPEVEASTRLAWAHGPVSAEYRFDYIGGNYWNAYNGKTPANQGPLFPVRRLHALALTIPSGLPDTDVTLEVRNLLDERFQDVMGYPLPGRSVSMAVVVGL
jgi:outer membrane cobalamin receptor